jgi:pimeloyl-ACP methyl ester carboxylesterase
LTIRSTITFALLAAGLGAGLAQAAPASSQGRSCHLPGVEEALRCLTVKVPLQQAKPDGQQLALHVTIAPAFRESARGDPLFVLAGGPGEAGSDIAPLLNSAFRRVRATRDIVLIDQRGTGRSENLDCPDKPGNEKGDEADFVAEARDCIAHAKYPLSAFTTAAAAADIERVRLALGYGKINVWGGSYGTRLGQVYTRAYPASVRALVLDGVAAPDQVIPAGGRDSQAALSRLFKQCAELPACAAAYPNLPAEFKSLIDKVAAQPVKIELPDPRTAAPTTVTMTSNHFLKTVHSMLYSAVDSRRLPFLLHNAYQGRWAPFVARSKAAGDMSSEGGLGTVLHFAVVCAEDAPRMTPELLAEDGRDAFMAGADHSKAEMLCKAANVPAVPYTAPSTIEAPVLMLSGALDPVTPPRRAEAAATAMRHVQHIVAERAGHGVTMLGCAPRLLREFLDAPTAKVDATCLSELPALSFQLGSAGPQP